MFPVSLVCIESSGQSGILSDMLSQKSIGWRDGFIGKSTCCSDRGRRGCANHPYGSSQPSGTPVPRVSVPTSDLYKH